MKTCVNKHVRMFSYKKPTCSHVFSLISAHFYPPLHHNGKGSIARTWEVITRKNFVLLCLLLVTVSQHSEEL